MTDTIKTLISIISLILECITIKLFLDTCAKRKENAFYTFLMVIDALGFLLLSISNNYEGSLLYTSLFIFGFTLAYDIRFFKKLLYTFLVLLIMAALENITALIVGVAFNIAVSSVPNNLMLFTFGLLVSKFLTYLTIKIYAIHIQRKTKVFSAKKMYLLSFSTIGVIIFFYIIGRLVYLSDDPVVVNLGSMTLLLSTFIYLVFIESYDWYTRMMNSEKELLISNQQLEFQRIYNDQINENQNKLRNIKHDLKNKLIGIEGVLLSKDYDKALAYVRDITNDLHVSSLNIYTGNSFIDSLLQSKVLLGDKINASFNVTVDFFVLGIINEVDVGILIASALDNALEAVEHLSTREITMVITTKKDYLCIKIENTIDPNQEINLEHTSKNTDKSMHGFGVLNIKKITEKYKGDCSYSFENNKIILNVILRNFD